jgi:hypothetical protein
MNRIAKSAGGKTPLIIARAGLEVSRGREISESSLLGEFTDPGKPRLSTKSVDVGDQTNKSNGNSPNDDQTDSQSPRDDSSDLSLVRVHLQVAPLDILGDYFDASLGHSEFLVGRRDQSSKGVSLGLRCESNECSVGLRVLVWVLS